MIPRRSLALLPLTASAVAQTAFPSRPLTLIVPFAAGGNVDTVARIAAAMLARNLGQSVVVENAPGAGGTIGTERAARAAPDGHTLLLGVESPLAIAPSVMPAAVRYNPEADFTPLAMLASLPLVLMARPDLPARDLAGLIDLAKRTADPLTYGTSGIGTSLHLWAETLAQRAELKLEHVPYRIAAQIAQDVLAGRLDLAVLTVTSAAPLVRDGRARGLAVSSAREHSSLPGVPPASNHPAFVGTGMLAWQGVLAPARTPPGIADRLMTALDALHADPEFPRQLELVGMTPWRLTPEEFARLVAEDSARYAAVARAAKIRIE
ncbi:Bug family tripartite tricarboxylate transporter substrate binding protein [Sabulicella glaciei]|uniref:Tripartite tricarboxylate transporter substrate binding protein n=1 Tax=Sabulicella glaciei TaxID=2984948 RepID=A0ABT3NRN2_9PROT|nr:tripartite tricarboxylate transporter substrate binding protein [Roseococcus sp. MDT2-1-1]MCW8084822.1 tripartite tricarboxylate transporter substrate binding protein [Roseococcus sp. MDT2-1-1]